MLRCRATQCLLFQRRRATVATCEHEELVPASRERAGRIGRRRDEATPNQNNPRKAPGAVLVEALLSISVIYFRQLVNRRRRALVNEVNILAGYPTIEIVSPPEL